GVYRHNSTANQTLSGVISGTGAIEHTGGNAGTSTLTLSGANTYTGDTTVSAGTLQVDGIIASVTVDNGASLTGSGSITGAATISGTLAIGNSPGTMTFSSLTLNGGSTTIMEIDGTAGAGVTSGHDFADVSGALVYGGALTLDIGTTFEVGNYTFDLFDFASETGTFSSMVLADQYSGSLLDGDLDGIWDLTDGNDTWQFTESNGILSLTVVPEPSAYALLLGVFGMTFVALRRRR
ncbi:MAG: autotransporter-associated beta strand repeat-containing protein, partial [Opitutales bacterium]|nr:autotransporter-associated beta strand repeat-containing protein [Opitutales bacterium]MDP4883542.1 autotransporter-associated beta strand repeat-containing protein [Opitutales bacterium]